MKKNWFADDEFWNGFYSHIFSEDKEEKAEERR
jgi:hypothetical protein